MRHSAIYGCLTLIACLVPLLAQAETVKAFQGAIEIETPEKWKSVQPKSRIIEKEYTVTREGVEGAARVTMMAAGGGIDANIKRWIGQFSGRDKEAKTEKMDVRGNEVHWVELEGTFKESMGGGPFFAGKTVMRENYQMLGAIVVNQGRKFFIKMTGPKEIVNDNKAAFKEMLKGIK